MVLKQSAVCGIPVATVWSSPDKARDVDMEGLSATGRINNWVEAMNMDQTRDLMESGRIETQLLYGEPVEIDVVVDGWAKIAALWQPSGKDERGYPGWVPVAQLKEVELFEEFDYARITGRHAQLWTPEFKPLTTISFNTKLPVLEVNDFVRVQTPDGDALIRSIDVEILERSHAKTGTTGADIVKMAEQFLNLQYFWGGMSSYGYDCSGLTFNVFGAAGIKISRDAGDQAIEGESVDKNSQTDWQVGDLLFFADDYGRAAVRHVGIYYGNGMMIHSPTAGQGY
ncbi:C40 family peptidase [Metaplanococcus flavidus]|uniref:NlpC/P60 family protein n=1 Tax=Metaplanococcus flavidus TaxID=569883 RepID=A0ABW3LEQ2_9BACL